MVVVASSAAACRVEGVGSFYVCGRGGRIDGVGLIDLSAVEGMEFSGPCWKGESGYLAWDERCGDGEGVGGCGYTCRDQGSACQKAEKECCGFHGVRKGKAGLL